MKITRKKNKDISTLSFDGELTIYHVTECKDELFVDHERLAEKIALDLHSLSEIDTAGIQLLLYAQMFFAKLHKTVYIVKSNEIVDAVLAQLGIAKHFSRES